MGFLTETMIFKNKFYVGLKDSFRGIKIVSNMVQPVEPVDERNAKVLSTLFRICLINFCLVFGSVISFEYVMIPLFSRGLEYLFGDESSVVIFSQEWIIPGFTFVFKTLWVVPLITLLNLINGLYFQDIADMVYNSKNNKVKAKLGFWATVSDTIFNLSIQFLFLFQGSLLEYYLPYYSFGYILNVIHKCLLHSLYCFELHWLNMGMELHQRLDQIQSNCLYFIGFGLPLTLISLFPYIIRSSLPIFGLSLQISKILLPIMPLFFFPFILLISAVRMK